VAFQTIEYGVSDHVATICLNRPEKMNSFNLAMHAELREALKFVQTDASIRCLVVTGNGRAFSAGQDLQDRYQLLNSGEPPNLGASLQKQYNLLVKSLAELPIPVIGAINGLAAGAGVGIVMACDIVVAARSAKFVFAFARVGLIPDSGCTWSLVQALGLPRAKALLLQGETISATDAQDAGMIWRCVDDADLNAEVARTVERLQGNPAVGLGLNKRALNAAASNSLVEQLNKEAGLQTIAGRSADYAEAVRAFVEKRQPEFSGK